MFHLLVLICYIFIMLQLQDEIVELQKQLIQKEEELDAVKKELGITALTELKEGMMHGWKVVGNKWRELQETDT